jgi:NAD(P)H-hydrate repair Nnr-like enzyme with NAD(P)H-hydrate dehydratase domain
VSADPRAALRSALVEQMGCDGCSAGTGALLSGIAAALAAVAAVEPCSHASDNAMRPTERMDISACLHGTAAPQPQEPAVPPIHAPQVPQSAMQSGVP